MMRITNLSVSNFRCIRNLELDLSADVVAVYGRNGTGKTAIFDAIEFALFGAVARLEDQQTALQNVFATDEASVQVTFSDSTTEAQLDVALAADGPRLARSEEWQTHNDFLYSFLVNPDHFPPRREIQQVREMFRASLMLSQSSLRDFVEGAPEERGRVMARLAGSAYYQRCLDKARSVVAEAGRRGRSVNSDLQESSDLLREAQEDLEAYRARVAVWKEESPVAEGDSPVQKGELDQLLRTLNIDPLPEQAALEVDDLALAHAALEATLEERATRVQEKLRRLTKLQALCDTHRENLARQFELTTRTRVLREDLSAQDREVEKIAEAMEASEEEVSRATGRLSRLEELSRAHEHLEEAREGRTATGTAVERREEAATENEGRVIDLAAQVSAEETEVAKLREQLTQLEREQEYASRRQEELEDLQVRLTEASEVQETLVKARGELRQVEAASEDQEERLTTLRTRLEELRSEVAASDSKINQWQEKEERRSALINGLKDLVDGPTCPACGHNHGLPGAVFEALESQSQMIPQTLAAELDRRAQLREELQTASQEESQIESELAEIEEQKAAALRSIREMEEQLAELEADAGALGLMASVETVEAEVGKAGQRAEEATEALRTLSDELARDSESLAALRSDLENATIARDAAVDALHRMRARFAEQSREVARLEGAWKDGCEILDLPLESLDVGKEVEKQKQEVARTKAVRPEQDQRRTDVMRKRQSLAGELDLLEEERADRQARLEEFAEESRKLGFDDAPDPRSIEARRQELNSISDIVLEARKMAARYVRSRRMGAASEHLAILEATADERNRKFLRNQELLRKFEHSGEEATKWVGVLESTVNEAVEHTVQARRLEIERHFKAMIPASYLFDSLWMTTDPAGHLRLGVRYRDQVNEAGEPKYYLSNGEANVLALALFFSMASKQEWSRLNTILLDDPVQHLDDLDAVAMLDTIRALSLGRYGPRRQIIVSTCDQRLYLLLCRKLHGLPDLRFAGISLSEGGREGPVASVDIGKTNAA